MAAQVVFAPPPAPLAPPAPLDQPLRTSQSLALGAPGLLKHVAATAIQSVARRWRAREQQKKLADRKLGKLIQAATVVQTLWRRLTAWRERAALYEAHWDRKRAAASLRIQAFLSMGLARKLRAMLKRRKAAIKLQAAMRRRLARRKRKLFKQRALERTQKKAMVVRARLLQAVTRRWLSRKWFLFVKGENTRLSTFVYEESDRHLEILLDLNDRHSDLLRAEADRHADELRRVTLASDRAAASRRHLEAIEIESDRHAAALTAEMERYRGVVKAAEEHYNVVTMDNPKWALGGKGFGRWRVHSQEDVRAAATMLQAHCLMIVLRVRFLRFRGARMMQCAGRRFLARKRRLMLVRYKKNAAVFDSAIMIQSAFRTWRVRYPFHQWRVGRRTRAAVIVQVWWRYACKRTTIRRGLDQRLHRMRSRAAVCIQCFYRARNQRTSTWLLVIQEGIRRQREVLRRNAIIKVQAAVRRRRARRVYAGMLRTREAEIAKMMADLIGSQVESVKEVTLEHIWLEHQAPSRDEAIFAAVEELWAAGRHMEGLAVLEEAHHRLAALAHVDGQARSEGRELGRALVLAYAALVARLVRDQLPPKSVEQLLTVVTREETWPMNTLAGRVVRRGLDVTAARGGADLPDRRGLRAVALDTATVFLLSRGQAGRALEFAEKAVKCCAPGANPHGATTLSSTVLLIRAAAVASRVGRHEQAQELLDRAIDSFTPEAQARSLRSAIDFRARAHWSPATGALALTHELPEPPAGSANKWLLAVCHQNCAVELIALGQNRKAQQVCQDAIRLVSNSMPTSHPWLLCIHKTHLVARHNIFADLHDDEPPPRSPKPVTAVGGKINWDSPASLMPKYKPPPPKPPAPAFAPPSTATLGVPSDAIQRRPSLMMRLALASAPSSQLQSFQLRRQEAAPTKGAHEGFAMAHLRAMQEANGAGTGSKPPSRAGSAKGTTSPPNGLRHAPGSVGGWAGHAGEAGPRPLAMAPSASTRSAGPRRLEPLPSRPQPRGSPSKSVPAHYEKFLSRPKSSPVL